MSAKGAYRAESARAGGCWSACSRSRRRSRTPPAKQAQAGASPNPKSAPAKKGECQAGASRGGRARARRRAADPARAVRRLGRLYGEQRRQAGLLRARQAVLAGDAAAEPAARSGLYLRLDAPGRERAQRDLDRDRLSVQAGLRGDASISARRNTRCTRRTTAPGSRTPPRKRAWSTPCAGSDLVVTGESGKGTKSTDRYSLQGPRAGARPRRAGVQMTRRSSRAESGHRPASARCLALIADMRD